MQRQAHPDTTCMSRDNRIYSRVVLQLLSIGASKPQLLPAHGVQAYILCLNAEGLLKLCIKCAVL